MNEFTVDNLKKLYVPKSSSKKGENGKLMIIAGSILFHAASLWPLTVASRIVDMVYYSSVSMNNDIVQKDKEMFQNGIIVPRRDLEKYVEEADCILIGPGLPRDDGREELDDKTKDLTEELLTKFPNKKWVIDGGSLQTIDPKVIPDNSILTPNRKEFYKLFEAKNMNKEISINPDLVKELSGQYHCVVLLKGEVDYISDGLDLVQVSGGNAGMTKGGTGDVLAGLVASFYCKNNALLSATAASYINKKAGESLSQKMGIYFNASDLANEIPVVMKNLLTA
jgi:hydroxyethylthiazole kinase-like uncharacterized protein yjeF